MRVWGNLTLNGGCRCLCVTLVIDGRGLLRCSLSCAWRSWVRNKYDTRGLSVIEAN